MSNSVSSQYADVVRGLLPDHPDALPMMNLLLAAPRFQHAADAAETLIRLAGAVALLLLGRKLEARLLAALDQPENPIPPASLIRCVTDLHKQAMALLEETERVSAETPDLPPDAPATRPDAPNPPTPQSNTQSPMQRAGASATVPAPQQPARHGMSPQVSAPAGSPNVPATGKPGTSGRFDPDPPRKAAPPVDPKKQGSPPVPRAVR